MSNIKKSITIQVSLFLTVSPIYATNVTTIDNTKTHQSRNKTPIFDIKNPNSKGLSHNKFKEYNVSQKGLILNNSRKDAVKTQIGGYIGRNKNLKSNAKVILNEVVNTSITNLNGPTEIAGAKADLVIANPNGININGASFINTNNLTLTTGKTNIKNGEISSFDVKGGEINIEGNGLNSTEQNSTNIYSRSLQINAKINAKKLNVVLGENNISGDGTKITKSSSTASSSENLILDSSALGGMYANKISIVGTQEGLGVKLPPEVLSSIDDFEITNDGFIEVNAVSSNKNINITSTKGDITVKKDLVSKEDISIDSNKNIVIEKATINSKATSIKANNKINLNKSTLRSKEFTDVKAKKLTNTGKILVGFNDNDSNNPNGNLNLKIEDKIDNSGTILSGNNLHIDTKDLNNEKDILSKGEISINLEHNFENKGLIQSDKNLNILFNTNYIDNEIINTNFNNSGTIYSKSDLFIKTDFIDNNSNILANGNIGINLSDTINNTGQILTNQIFSISANTLNNNSQINAKDIEIDVKNMNNKGKVLVDNVFNVTASNFTNSAEVSANNVFFETTNFLNQGTLNSKDELLIKTTQFTNENIVQGKNKLDILSKDEIINKGQINSDKELTLETNLLLNDKDSSIYSNENIVISGFNENTYLSNFVNRGKINAINNTQISTVNFNNYNQINSEKLNVNTNGFNNRGTISSEQFTLKTDTFKNETLINTNEKLDIKTNSFENNGTIQSKIVEINVDENLINHNNISTTEKLKVFAKNIFNYGTILSNKILNLEVAEEIDSQNLQAGENLEIKANKLINKGHLASEKDLDIDVNTLVNTEKTIEAKENLNIVVENFNHENTTLKSEGNLSLKLIGNKDFHHNENTNISANEDITIDAYSIFNNKRLSTKGSIFLKAQGLLENNNIINAKEDLNILMPKEYKEEVGSGLILFSQIYNNQNSMLIANGNLQLEAMGFENNSTVFSGNNMNLILENTLLNTSNIYALKDLNISNRSVFNQCKDNFLACKDFEGPNIENRSAKITTNSGDINIIANDFYNKRKLNYEDLVSIEEVIHSYYGSDLLLGGKQGVKIKNTYKNDAGAGLIDFYVNLKDKYKIELDVTRAYTFFHDGVEGIKIKGTIIKRQNQGKEGEESLLSSGKNLLIKVKNDFVNEVSRISSFRNMTLEGKNAFNNAIETSGKITASGKMSGSGTVTLYDWNKDGKRETINLRKNNNFEVIYDKSFLGENLSSSITAGGDINSNFEEDFINKSTSINVSNQNNPFDEPIDDIATSDTNSSNLNNNKDIAKDLNFNELNTDERNLEDITSNISIPSNNFGLFILNKDPSATYLIETNPEFSLEQNFIGSDYFTNQLDYDESITTKKIGDAFYENKLVLDSIRNQTGKESLYNDLSKEQQYKKLMDNALSVKNDLELIPGLSLTKMQVNNLKESIVWLEEKIVKGQKVLVPTVYIANIDDVKITGASISANENLIIKADNITNQLGNISANGNVVLSAKNNINNLGGDISSTEANVALFTEEGDINIKTVDINGKKIQSNINAKNSVILNSGNDINTEASNINAGENVYLKAQNNITDLAVIEESSNFTQNGNTTTRSTTQTVTSSNFNGNNVVLDAGNQMVLEATQIEADNAISLKAKDILVLGKESTNTSSNSTTRTNKKSESIFNKEKKTTTTTREESNTSITKANFKVNNSNGGNGSGIYMNAENIALLATDLESKNSDINIKASENVLIGDMRERSKSTSSTEKNRTNSGISSEGMGYVKETYNSTTTRTTNNSVGSKLNSNNINISSGGNTTLIGSNLNSQNDTTIVADSIDILAAQNFKNVVSKTTKTKEGSTSFEEAASSIAKNGLERTQLGVSIYKKNEENITRENIDITNNKSTISSKSGNINLVSNKDINAVGFDFNAKEEINLIAKDNVNLSDVKDIKYSKTTKTTNSTEVTAAIRNTYAEAGKAATARSLDAAGVIEKEDIGHNRSAASDSITGATASYKAATADHGFSAGVRGNTAHSTKTRESFNTRTNSSSLKANNLNISAKGKVVAKGTNIDITDTTKIKAKSFKLLASENISISKVDKRNHNREINAFVSGKSAKDLAIGAGLADDTTSTATSNKITTRKTNTSSTLKTNNLVLDVEDKAINKGSTITANNTEKNVTIDNIDVDNNTSTTYTTTQNNTVGQAIIKNIADTAGGNSETNVTSGQILSPVLKYPTEKLIQNKDVANTVKESTKKNNTLTGNQNATLGYNTSNQINTSKSTEIKAVTNTGNTSNIKKESQNKFVDKIKTIESNADNATGEKATSINLGVEELSNELKEINNISHISKTSNKDKISKIEKIIDRNKEFSKIKKPENINQDNMKETINQQSEKFK